MEDRLIHALRSLRIASLPPVLSYDWGLAMVLDRHGRDSYVDDHAAMILAYGDLEDNEVQEG